MLAVKSDKTFICEFFISPKQYFEAKLILREVGSIGYALKVVCAVFIKRLLQVENERRTKKCRKPDSCLVRRMVRKLSTSMYKMSSISGHNVVFCQLVFLLANFKLMQDILYKYVHLGTVFCWG